MSPAVGFVLILIGALLFTQTVMGDAVARLLSYAESSPEGGVTARSAIRADNAEIPATAKGRTRKFLALLLSQRGTPYVYGAEVDLEDKTPDAFDCSEFIQWAMGQLGFPNFPDGSANQIGYCRAIPVRAGIRTPGALLYAPGHIAVSLGDGRTIEARGRDYGTDVFSARGRSWSRAGLIPELVKGSR